MLEISFKRWASKVLTIKDQHNLMSTLESGYKQEENEYNYL